jgi:hypothetical protein
MYSSVGIVEPDELGEIHSGDVNQGDGVSTGQLGNVNVPLNGAHDQHQRKVASSNPLTQSPLVWAVVVGCLVLVKYLTEKAGDKSEFSTIRIGLENWFIGGLIAATFIFVLKVCAALNPSDAPWAMAVRQFAGLT